MTRRAWITVSILVLLIAGMWIWLRPATPTAFAEQALESDQRVTVTDDGWLAFRPAGGQAATGLVFYPGGLIPAEAYAPLARALADAGYLIVIPHMPLNLAIFESSAAEEVIAEYDDVETWVVGGHSLGGAMAATFVSGTTDVAGLVMVGAYPTQSTDVSAASVRVLVIYGTEDALSTPEEVLAAAPQYPPDADFVVIEGGNHAQFGSYGTQRGDRPAAISASEQLDQTVAAMLTLLVELDGD